MSTSQDVPIKDNLRNLGVTKFVKQGDLVQIIVSRHKVISFNIHPKQFQRTMERFRESALNSTADLSGEIINKMERVLVHPDNGYILYLQSNSNGKQESESEFGTENLNQAYATVHTDKISLYEGIIIDGVPVFAKISLGSSKISLCTEIQLSDNEVLVPLPFNFTIPMWELLPDSGKLLRWIFSVDGSTQSILSDAVPYKRIAFVKTALLRLNLSRLSEIDKTYPHPLALRDLLTNSALYHATVFPLQNVSIPGYNNYNAIRNIIFESIKDKSPPLNGEPMETLKWIAYEKWNKNRKELPVFQCPHCERDVATLQYDEESGECPGCHCQIFLTDMLGFHQVMAPDSAPDSG